MGRRAMMAGLLAIGLAAAGHARAQTVAPPPPRVVIVSGGTEGSFREFRNRFVQGMQDLGHGEGRTYRLEVVYANREPTRTPALIQQAVATRADVLVVAGLTAALRARDATTTVPVVVATSSDLVDSGIVKSLAHPGSNITGLADLADEAAVKRLEMLKEMLPKASHVALLNNPDFPATPKIENRVGAAATALGIRVTRLYARDRASLSRALDSLEKLRPDALLLGGDALFTNNAQELIDRAKAFRVPVVHYWPGTAEMGALFSHQADIHGNYQRAASYVDRILKGAKPGDLPIEQPTRYELVINRKAAAAFGITLPQVTLLRADRVIE